MGVGGSSGTRSFDMICWKRAASASSASERSSSSTGVIWMPGVFFMPQSVPARPGRTMSGDTFRRPEAWRTRPGQSPASLASDGRADRLEDEDLGPGEGPLARHADALAEAAQERQLDRLVIPLRDVPRHALDGHEPEHELTERRVGD